MPELSSRLHEFGNAFHVFDYITEAGKVFDQVTKKAIINLLMDNNIDAVNITESDITFKYKDGLFRVTMVN